MSPLKSHTILYVVGVIFMALVTVGAVLVVRSLGLEAHEAADTISTIRGITEPVIGILLALIGHQIYLTMNSRLDQLVAAERKAALAEGQEQGRVLGVAQERADSLRRRSTDRQPAA